MAYFKTSTIDLLMLNYVCLYSPMLELKAVGWRRDAPGPRVWLSWVRACEFGACGGGGMNLTQG